MSKEVSQAAGSRPGIAAYLSLAIACVFFSGALASSEWYGVFDFTTLCGGWGKVVASASLADDGILKTAMANFRGRGGSGAIDGFCLGLSFIPTIMFALGMVALFERLGALRAAQRLMTPLLRPLLGIPGVAALTLIASLQSTDGSAAMTRRLKDDGILTTKELLIFGAFMMTADAAIGSFLASGSVLFTMKDASGAPVLPITIGFALAVILVGKVLGANIMRLILFRMDNGKAADGAADALDPAAGQRHESTAIDAFIAGAKQGWSVAIGSMLPNVLVAFVIIKALNITGILDIVGSACGPVMAVFGLPGEALMVLLTAWVSSGGGVGMAIALFENGTLSGLELAALVPPIYLMGAQLQYFGRCLGVIGYPGRQIFLIMSVPPVVAAAALFAMRFILSL